MGEGDLMKTMLTYPDAPPSRMISRENKMFFHAVREVCEAMREDEIEQYMAIAGADRGIDQYNPQVAALGMINTQGVGFYYLDDNANPCAVGGYSPDPYMAGVWQSWMAGTQAGWDNHWQDLTKGTRWLMGQLMDGGARRLETNVLASRAEAQRWYVDFLGMQYEGVRRSYTATGEDVLLYGFTDKDWVARWEEQDGKRRE